MVKLIIMIAILPWDRSNIVHTIYLTEISTEYLSYLDSLTNLVSVDSVTSYITRLQNFQTRYSFSDSVSKAADWLFNKFKEFGYDSVYFDSFPHPENYSSLQNNIVALKLGDMTKDKLIVIGGHYDSVVYDGADPYTWAPGADDNASGTSGVLEIARVLANVSLDKTIIFVPFAAEEQGLYGSDYFADAAADNGMDIELMINMDMIGYEKGSTWNVAIESNSEYKSLVDLAAEMALLYSDNLQPEVAYNTGAYSDHWPFLENGYPALFFIEGDFNYNNWHQNTDVIDSLNLPFLSQIVEGALATLIYTSERPGPPESLLTYDPGDGESIEVQWSKSQENDVIGYWCFVRRRGQGYSDSVWTNDTVVVMNNLTTSTTHYFAVVAQDSLGFNSVYSKEITGSPTSIREDKIGKLTRCELQVKNPTRKSIDLLYTLGKMGKVNFKLYDPTGRIIAKQDVQGREGMNRLLWQISDLSSGIYFLEVYISSNRYMKKVILFR